MRKNSKDTPIRKRKTPIKLEIKENIVEKIPNDKTDPKIRRVDIKIIFE